MTSDGGKRHPSPVLSAFPCSQQFPPACRSVIIVLQLLYCRITM